MSKKDIYEIAVKLLGIYFSLIALNQLKEFLLYVFFLSEKELWIDDTVKIFSALVMVGSILIIYLLLFQTQKIVNLITKSSDNEVLNLNLTKKDTFQICFVLAGILTIVFAVPSLIHVGRDCVLTTKSGLEYEKIRLIVPVIEIIFGGVLIKFSTQLSDYINYRIK